VQFAIDVTLSSSVLLVGNALSAEVGIVTDLSVNRISRKSLGVFTAQIAVLLTLVFTFMPTLVLLGFECCSFHVCRHGIYC
jgi:cytosine/uracil/thiamine/allantoin permease